MNSLSFGSPLFGAIQIGRKKRSEFNSDLQILRERIIRTGRPNMLASGLTYHTVVFETYNGIIFQLKIIKNI